MSDIKIEHLSPDELEKRDVHSWPIWEKGISKFDWTYEAKEECYIIEGEVEITIDEQKIMIEVGQFITFEKGLSCFWDIKKAIRKYYNFPSDK